MTIKEHLIRMSKYAKPNVSLLPLKAHMFLYFGAAVGVMPFAAVIAKQLGISAGQIGIINTVLLFLSVAMKFLIGSLTDKLQKLKLVLIVVIVVEGIFHIFIILVPPLRGSDVTTPVNITGCEPINGSLNVCFSESPSSVCNAEGDCSVECSYDSSSSSEWKLERNKDSSCLCEQSEGCTLLPPQKNTSLGGICSSKDIACLLKCSAAEKQHVVYMLPFWLFVLFRIVSGMAWGVGISLTDAATYGILRERKQDYGKQRLWGTIGWGVMAPVVGMLNDLATNGSSYVDYSPGFYLLGAFTILDIIGLCFLDVPTTSTSQEILKDVSRVLVRPSALFFIFSVFNMGCLMGLIWSYALWYLQDLGASSTLLGVNLAVQCFGGEVPVLFFSGWIIRKIGYNKAITLSIAGVVVRLAVYTFGNDPWAMLPIEITHGLCFGLFYAAMTSYASSAAPPGTEATMQGILGGTFEGLGIGCGTLVAGQLFNWVKGRNTFYIFFLYSLAFLVTHAAVDLCMSRKKSAKAARVRDIEVDGHDTALALHSPTDDETAERTRTPLHGAKDVGLQNGCCVTFDKRTAAHTPDGSQSYVIA